MKNKKIIVEEFVFDEANDERSAGAKPKLDRSMARKNFFAEIKVKMVMRIYGVSRSKAERIIAERCKTMSAPAVGKDRSTAAMSKRRPFDDDMIPMDDFLGE